MNERFLRPPLPPRTGGVLRLIAIPPIPWTLQSSRSVPMPPRIRIMGPRLPPLPPPEFQWSGVLSNTAPRIQGMDGSFSGAGVSVVVTTFMVASGSSSAIIAAWFGAGAATGSAAGRFADRERASGTGARGGFPASRSETVCLSVLGSSIRRTSRRASWSAARSEGLEHATARRAAPTRTGEIRVSLTKVLLEGGCCTFPFSDDNCICRAVLGDFAKSCPLRRLLNSPKGILLLSCPPLGTS